LIAEVKAMIAFLEGPDLLVVLVVVLLMFGGTKLPQLARSLGQAQKEFQRGLRDEPEPGDKDKEVDSDRATGDDTAADKETGS